MGDDRIFSADSHVAEPGDLWVQRLDQELRFRAPRVEQRERDGRLQDFFIYEGYPPHPVSIGLGAAASDRTAFLAEGKGYGDARPGGWDPAARLADQDLDGVEGEVLFTTLGFRLFWLRDARLQRACMRAYNDWLAEYCAYCPSRLVGVPLISLIDIPEAVAELRRVANLGLRGAMVWLSPPAEYPPFTSAFYDPFWAEAQELGAPVALHEITGGAESRLMPAVYWDPHAVIGEVVRPHEAQRSLAQLIYSGALERFPRLKVVSAENDTDWLPWFVARLQRPIRPGLAPFPTTLSLAPVEYLRRQVCFTYIDEPDTVPHRETIGVDNLMFATDYPHAVSTWPHSQRVVERDTAHLAPEERRKLVHDNALRVFGIPAPAPA